MYPASPTNLKFRLIRSANLHRWLQIKEHKLAHNRITLNEFKKQLYPY